MKSSGWNHSHEVDGDMTLVECLVAAAAAGREPNKPCKPCKPWSRWSPCMAKAECRPPGRPARSPAAAPPWDKSPGKAALAARKALQVLQVGGGRCRRQRIATSAKPIWVRTLRTASPFSTAATAPLRPTAPKDCAFTNRCWPTAGEMSPGKAGRQSRTPPSSSSSNRTIDKTISGATGIKKRQKPRHRHQKATTRSPRWSTTSNWVPSQPSLRLTAKTCDRRPIRHLLLQQRPRAAWLPAMWNSGTAGSKRRRKTRDRYRSIKRFGPGATAFSPSEPDPTHLALRCKRAASAPQRHPPFWPKQSPQMPKQSPQMKDISPLTHFGRQGNVMRHW